MFNFEIAKTMFMLFKNLDSNINQNLVLSKNTHSYNFFYLPYLSSIHEKAMYRRVLDGKSALAWELPFPGHLSST